MTSALLYSVLGFLLGALPFSVWLGLGLRGKDPRQVGDGNPGAANAWRAGGPGAGLLVLFLDAAKGGSSVALSRFVGGVHDWGLLPVSLAPVLGHVVSPFLRFRGGKGITTTFGVWSALTFWEVPTVFGLSLAVGLAILRTSGWIVVAAGVVALAYLLARRAPGPLVVAWGANLLLLAWTHRSDLARLPSSLRKGER